MAVVAETNCTAYWAKFVDPDGAVSLTVLFFAVDDREAKYKAKMMVDAQGVDLWDAVRLIEHFPPELRADPARSGLGCLKSLDCLRNTLGEGALEEREGVRHRVVDADLERGRGTHPRPGCPDEETVAGIDHGKLTMSVR